MLSFFYQPNLRMVNFFGILSCVKVGSKVGWVKRQRNPTYSVISYQLSVISYQ
ncbi:hypothetical protein [Okeania sp. KiyG1]|uniref:hypothetical protein n=1 Tax=Okeania sp. KiyG1 TaxID=2720165 RepID=UPI001F180ECF|nr:hypothetical protein [Okeania sp. KiyG1]